MMMITVMMMIVMMIVVMVELVEGLVGCDENANLQT